MSKLLLVVVLGAFTFAMLPAAPARADVAVVKLVHKHHHHHHHHKPSSST
jgi:hypothetical protein